MKLKRLVKDTWLWKFTNTKPGKYVKFFVFIILDLIDLAVDWFFYGRVASIQPGLVYGPPESAIKWSILTFCVISVIGFAVETFQNADDLFFGHKIKFLSQSLSNFFVIFFEDIPLLVLNLIVTICRDGDPTVISVVKASVGIAIVIIRVLLMMLIYWLLDTKKNRFTLIIDVLSSIGLFVIAGISIAIQLLNNFPTDSRGVIQSTDPTVFNRMSYATDKYLKNVSIYTKWPMDDPNLVTNNSITTGAQSPADFYIWLADITDVINTTNLNVDIKTDFNSNSNDNQNYTICFIKSTGRNCYSVVNSSSVNELDATLVDSILARTEIANNGYKISIFKEPASDYSYKIGYLDYNLNKFISNGNSNKFCSQSTASQLFYAKFANSAGSNSSVTYFKKNLQDYTFYSVKYDLLTVDKFWRTGIVGCKMSGDLGPKLNRDIRVVC